MKANDDFNFSVQPYPPERPNKTTELFDEPLGPGPTIIYVPTRNETIAISDFLRDSGVRAAAYNAKVCLNIFILSVDKLYNSLYCIVRGLCKPTLSV